MSGPAAGPVATERGRRTRARILATALELFRERGYEQTTMREIARRAEVSLGNAYYYFRSKEHLIQAFYARTHEEHLAACSERLASESELHRRLVLVLRTKIDTSMPYHRFAGILFKTAADPYSPLSPFSPESEPVRLQATQLFEKVLVGSKQRPSGPLAAELPGLLWLYQMGILLFWIHDESAGCTRTYRLIEGTSTIITRLIRLAGNPVLRPLTQRALRLMAELRAQEEPVAQPRGSGSL